MAHQILKPIHFVVVAALLTLHAWLAVSATANTAATWDEPLHITGGYAYATVSDFRLHPENGALPQRWAGLVLRGLSPKLPRAGYEKQWERSNIGALSTAFLYDVGNDHRAVVSTARRAAILWSVLLGLAVFAWTWTLWGASAGLFALTLHAISPTFLAHGALVTSDVCGTLFILVGTWAWWRHLNRPSTWTLLLSASVAGIAAIAKFSVAVLPPLFVLLAAWKLWTTPVWRAHFGRDLQLRGLLARAGYIVGALVVHALVAALVIWTTFDFQHSPVGAGMPPLLQYHAPWSYVFSEGSSLTTVLTRMNEWQLLPEAYIYGFGFVMRFAESRPAFLNGEFGATGWWWFFPYAFLIKSTLAELIAVAATITVAVAAWRVRNAPALQWLRERGDALVPLVGLVLVYVAFSVTSNLNIGHRHLLPIYPALFVMSGVLLAPSAARWSRVLAVCILALGSVESFAVRPHYLAFFNATVGGPSQGWRQLVDSSLDWGQDLPALADWLASERKPDEALYYNVFGQRRARAFGIEGVEIAPAYPESSRRWVTWGPGIYAVSATLLQDVYSPFAGVWDTQKEVNFQFLASGSRRQRESDPASAIIGVSPDIGNNYWTLERLQFARLMNYLRLREPAAVLGHTIFVHRLGAAEMQVITEGDSQSYLALLESVR